MNSLSSSSGIRTTTTHAKKPKKLAELFMMSECVDNVTHFFRHTATNVTRDFFGVTGYKVST